MCLFVLVFQRYIRDKLLKVQCLYGLQQLHKHQMCVTPHCPTAEALAKDGECPS